MNRMLFLNGTVIDGQGGLAERSGLLAESGRIAKVGPTTALEAHRKGGDVTVVDLGGRTLMPGLIDSHVHLAGGDFVPTRENESLGIAVLRTLEAAQRSVLAGITTIRAAGSRDFIDCDVRDAIKLMLSPGIATQGADVNSEQFTIEEVKAAVYEAHKTGRPVLSHAIGLGGIRNGVEAGVDSIDHGHYLDEEQARKMKAKGIYLVPTFGPTHYYIHERKAEPWRIERAEQVEPLHDQSFRMALEIGVPVAMGCDCGAQSRMPNGLNALEIELMVKHGMTPMGALVAGTRESAKLMRILDTVGTLEPGKAADLLVIDGSPVDDISRVRTSVKAVVQAGVVRRDDLGLARAK